MSDYRLVKHRGQWSLAFTEPGRGRVRIATGTAERGLAEARARDLWRARQKPQSERVADLWIPYAADRKATVARPDRFDHVWKPLEPVFGYKLGKAITKADCRAYAEQRRREGKANSTIKTELEMLRACLRWHYGKDAPAITAPAPSKPRERYLTKGDAELLLSKIETPHVRLFVILALGTGARMSAILDLTWDRVDFVHGTIDFMPAGRDDQQAAHGRPDEPAGAGGAGGCAQGRSDRLGSRVRPRAGEERQARPGGGSAAIRAVVLGARPAADRRSVDGAGRRADGEDRAISRAYVDPDHTGSLCPLFAAVHGDGSEGFGLVKIISPRGLTDRARCPIYSLIGPVAHLMRENENERRTTYRPHSGNASHARSRDALC
jgi:hypothetical protein